MDSMTRFINQEILRQAKDLVYLVKDKAPMIEIFQHGTLVVWSGASLDTIYNDPIVNYAFRALHDTAHIKSGIGFSVGEEIELARRQAAKQSSSLMADLIYIEVAEQALYYEKHGMFVADQKEFTLNLLKQKGF